MVGDESGQVRAARGRLLNNSSRTWPSREGTASAAPYSRRNDLAFRHLSRWRNRPRSGGELRRTDWPRVGGRSPQDGHEGLARRQLGVGAQVVCRFPESDSSCSMSLNMSVIRGPSLTKSEAIIFASGGDSQRRSGNSARPKSADGRPSSERLRNANVGFGSSTV